MDLARHGNINLTMARHSHTLLADRANCLMGLPDVADGPAHQEQAKATGMYDSATTAGHSQADSAKQSAKRRDGRSQIRIKTADSEDGKPFAKPLYGVIPVPQLRIPPSPF